MTLLTQSSLELEMLKQNPLMLECRLKRIHQTNLSMSWRFIIQKFTGEDLSSKASDPESILKYFRTIQIIEDSSKIMINDCFYSLTVSFKRILLFKRIPYSPNYTFFFRINSFGGKYVLPSLDIRSNSSSGQNI